MKEDFIKIDNNHFIGIDYPSKNGDYGCKSYIKLEEDGTFWVEKVEYFGENNDNN